MATSLDVVSQYLHQNGWHFGTQGEHIVFGFKTDNYLDGEGQQSLRIYITLDEEGEYFRAYCPRAFSVADDHTEAFLKCCAIIQWRTKLIQFEYDPEDGEVRPIIEFPLEDAPLTLRLLTRVVTSLIGLVEAYCAVLQHVAQTGEIDFDLEGTPMQGDHILLQAKDPEAILKEFTEDQLLAALLAKQKGS